MSMRNHWVDVSCSSRKTNVTTGPQGKNGTMNISVYQDDRGESKLAYEIKCYPVEVDSKTIKVVTDVIDANGELVSRNITYR